MISINVRQWSKHILSIQKAFELIRPQPTLIAIPVPMVEISRVENLVKISDSAESPS